MIYTLIIEPNAEKDIAKHKKHYQEREVYSRRIDKEHRLVYEIVEQRVIVVLISAFGHY